MDQWDAEEESEEESEELQPFIEFERVDAGHFQFGCVYGELEVRLGQREGQSAVECSWEGHDADEQLFGRGWAIVGGDVLHGMIFIHHGDESVLDAKRVTAKPARK